MPEFVKNIIIGVISSGLLGVIGYGITQYHSAEVSGEWKTTIHINKSNYIPYVGMGAVFELSLIQSGSKISGTGEKLGEIETNNSFYEYNIKQRPLVNVTGYVDHNYLSKDVINLSWVENGPSRETRSSFTLTVEDNSKLSGTFTTTGAESSGTAELVLTK